MRSLIPCLGPDGLTRHRHALGSLPIPWDGLASHCPPQVGQALCTSGTRTRFIKTISVRLTVMKSPFILVLGFSLPNAAYQKCFHVVISLVLLVSSGRSTGCPQGLCPRQGDSSPPFSCCGTHVAQRDSSAASRVWRRVSLTKILMT